jgi:hypothetical protein
MCDSVSVDTMLGFLEDRLGEYHEAHGKSYDEVKRESKLQSDHTQVDKDLNPFHIDYIIPVNNTQKQWLY